MRILFLVIISIALSSTALAAPQDRYQAVMNGLAHENPRVKFASLIALGKVAGVRSSEFTGFVMKALGEIDQRIGELASDPMTTESVTEANELRDRKIQIIDLLITEGDNLDHNPRMYLRAQLGNGEMDGYVTEKILDSLSRSKRHGKDQVLVGTLVKFMKLAELGLKAEPTAAIRVSAYSNLPAAAQIMINHRVEDTDLIQRMGRLLKAYHLPRQNLTAYMGRIRGKSCNEELKTTSSQND